MGASAKAFRDVFRNPALRRLELAVAGSVLAHWAFGVAVAVYAYREGGVGAVGLLGLVRMLPSAVAAPFTAVLGDRYPRDRVVLAAALLRGVAVALTAVAVVAGAPLAAVFALATVVQIVATASVPAKAALIPSLARTPAELTAANVVSTTIESVGSFLGPAAAGLLLAVTGLDVVLALTAGAFLWSAAMLARLPAHTRGERGEKRAEVGLLGGFRAVAAERDVTVVVALYAVQTLVAGALNVLVVVLAIEVLDLGEPGVGYLDAVIGIGGIAGAAVALALAARGRIAADFGLGLVLWGVPMVLIALWPEPLFALALLVLLGVGNTLVDVAAMTLLQRATPDAVLARVFGVVEALTWATIGLGAIVVPPLIDAFGARWALALAGAPLPLLALLAWRRLATIDARGRPADDRVALLRSLPLFAALDPLTLERLASALLPLSFPAGAEIVREGDPGELFYVIAEGEAEVSAGGRLGPGEFFGEIALLRDVPRTATVTAATVVEAYALERDEFVGAVAGHAEGRAAADAVVAARLRGLRSGAASV